jgi:uncharacterized phage-like protein YoqJ
MSSNNFILIKKSRGKYIVSDEDSEGDGKFQVGKFDTFKEAREFAYKYEQEELVEYGVSYSDEILDEMDKML